MPAAEPTGIWARGMHAGARTRERVKLRPVPQCTRRVHLDTYHPEGCVHASSACLARATTRTPPAAPAGLDAPSATAPARPRTPPRLWSVQPNGELTSHSAVVWESSTARDRWLSSRPCRSHSANARQGEPRRPDAAQVRLPVTNALWDRNVSEQTANEGGVVHCQPPLVGGECPSE